jgi:hypothetical protein
MLHSRDHCRGVREILLTRVRHRPHRDAAEQVRKQDQQNNVHQDDHTHEYPSIPTGCLNKTSESGINERRERLNAGCGFVEVVDNPVGGGEIPRDGQQIVGVFSDRSVGKVGHSMPVFHRIGNLHERTWRVQCRMQGFPPL